MKSRNAGVLEIIEAIYREEKNERAWIDGILDAAKPVVDEGLGVVGFPFEAGPNGFDVPFQRVTGAGKGLGPDLMRAVTATIKDDDRVQKSYRAVLCATGSEENHLDREGFKLMRPLGIQDSIGMVGVATNGSGVCLVALLPKITKLKPAVRARLSRVAAHLGVGQRYRRLLKKNESEAIFDANAKLVHAEGDATTREARAALTRAVVSLDRARGKQRRIDPDGALEAWKGLVDARWSLVDQFENDGKRFIVARENEPISPPLAALSKRERQIAGYLAIGHTSKLIAYELGISDSTVRVLIHRAMRRLNVKTQRDLAAAFMDAMRP
jgi:DNA-binding CsgD family transcriptional regulator